MRKANIVLTIEQIHICLKGHRPQTLASGTQRHAAVAMLLTDAEQGPELLFIRRAEFDGDPWSGDVAFPGGGIEPHDAGPQQAAERETREEIGLRLNPQQCLGQLDDLAGAYLPIRISCFVYLLAEKPALKLNGEVVDGFWVPLELLRLPERNREKTFAYRGTNRNHPIIDLNGYTEHFLWGISYRILQQFFKLTTNR
jgi:8-oxo-dGTP pyrophosphatase MutT (NUDIX family)